ncbi:MAG: non-canonical purine NTP pyrophosphatase [Halobacteriovoraceae bacterium]|jgi:XTP/dITP diphosphohydrolase|nr:non-canonical purine NTP pyrophosphatase [Halobacteriovoraceae bacterium]MBT5092987.1 non-canonical purine NTP pyrophosphatase [Halobacteriovoraceae bacterium]
MLELLLASGNPHKAQEFAALFDRQLLSVNAAPSKIEVLEDGETYFENALKKATDYYSQFKVPVISDDSGLTVEALPGELGIFSARFGGPGLSDEQRVEHLLEKLGELECEKRNAYFSCVLCFYLGPEEIYFFEGRLDGAIATEASGEEGFGYDPVFIPKNLKSRQSVACDPGWKAANSHRALACQKANLFFKERNGQKTPD